MSTAALGSRSAAVGDAIEMRLRDLERAMGRVASRTLNGSPGYDAKRISATTAGWAVGTWVKLVSGTWTSAATASSFAPDAIGVVLTVVDATTAEIVTGGFVQLLGTSYTNGALYYLSTSAGSPTSTPPAAPNVLQPLFVAYQDGWINVLGPSGAAPRSVTLAGLRDVTLTSPSDGQLLKYDIASGKWINGATTLALLSDVALTAPSNGQVVSYDTGTSKWINRTLTIPSLPVSVANGGTAKTGITSGTFWYASGTDTLSEATITAYGRALVACADAAAGRTQLALAAIAASGSGADLTTASVTLAKMADLAAARIIGRASGAGTGVPTALTGTQATAILDEMVASGASHAKGLVPDTPASSGTTKFLREDATWAIPSGAAATGSCNKITGGAQTVATVTSNVTITTWTAVGTATLSGIDVTTGIFTVPTDGLYLVTAYVNPTYAVGGTQQWDAYVDRNNASSPDTSLGRIGPYSFNSNLAGPFGGFSGVRFLTSGDTLRLRISNTGANTLTISEAHFNIVKLA